MNVRAATLAALALALAGPGMIAWAAASGGHTLGERSVGLIAFAALVVSVMILAHAAGHGDRKALGFSGTTWLSPLLAIALAAFFICVFGPAAYWFIAASGLGGFDAGAATFGELPRWYMVLVIVVVAGGEEWLYRAYAIEALERFTGRAWQAAAISTGAFFLVHLPVWGLGPSLTTLASGGILAALYVWRRDIAMLIIAHVATDLYGLLLSPSPAP